MCKSCLDLPEFDKAKQFDSEWADTVLEHSRIILKDGLTPEGQYRTIYRGQEKVAAIHPKDDGYVFIRWIYQEY